MGHRRVIQPETILVGDDLTAAMIGIGMNFAGRAAEAPNIEDTLLGAALAGMEEDDLRVLAVLTTWFGIHADYVLADRLTKIVKACESKRVRAYFAALATWRSRDHRFAAMAKLRPRRRVDLLRSGTDFQVQRRGEDERFADGPLRVPAGVLRDRPADVLSPHELTKRHAAYRWRVIIGPTYRADMWAAIEQAATLSTADLARTTYGSFATAWRAKRDASIVAANPR